MITKIIIGVIAILTSSIFAIWAYKKNKQLKNITRDKSGVFPIFKNYLDFFLGIVAFTFLVSGITMFLI